MKSADSAGTSAFFVDESPFVRWKNCNQKPYILRGLLVYGICLKIVTTHLSVSKPKALILLVNDDSHFLCIAKKEGNRRRNWPFLAIIEVLDATVSKQYQ
ncbi:MAG: hypothetical protein LBF72_01440, partial [Holosporales bacterium]|nr:hypothetical protein [Holosporales bacterium]